MATYLEQAARGTGGLVLITGDSGIGKSAFLADAQRRLRDSGALVVETRCRRGHQSYRPLAEVVRGAVEQLRHEGVAVDMAEQASALVETLSGRRPAAATTNDPAAERLGFFDQLSELLRQVAAVRTTAFVFHDLDCADRGTLEAIRYLTRTLTSRADLSNRSFCGLILCSCTDSSVAMPDQAWLSSVNLLHIDLAGLDAAGVRAYLNSDEVVQRLLQNTKGVPRLLEAVLSRSVESVGESLPLEGLLTAERRVLELLAVFGRPIGPETLRLLSGLPNEQIVRATTALVERGRIEKIVVDGELRLTFASVGDLRAFYEALPDETRRQLHSAIGAHLEVQGEAEQEACADHLLLGLGGPRAVRVTLAAGQRLESAYGFERAAELYERALTQVQSKSVRRQLLERLCAVCENTGQLERAMEHARELCRLQANDAECVLRLARLLRLHGDYAAAREELSSLGAGRELSVEQRARLAAELAENHLLAGDPAAAESSARRGLLICDADDEPGLKRVRLAIQNTLAKIRLDRNEPDAAAGLFRQNLETARAANLPGDEAWATAQLGLLHTRRGECAEAERCYEAASALVRGLRNLRDQAIFEQHLAVLAELRGSVREALRRYQEAVGLFKKVGNRMLLAWVGVDLGSLYLNIGDLERAKAMLELAERLTEKVTEQGRLPTLLINIERLRAALARRQRRHQEASSHLASAYRLAAATEQNDRASRVLFELGELDFDRGDFQAALTRLGEGCFSNPNHLRVRALLLRGRAETGLLAFSLAEEHLTEALDLAMHLPDPERAWQILLAMSAVASAQGRLSDSRRLLRQAMAGEEQMRRSIPEEFWPLIADQPERLALRQAEQAEPAPEELHVVAMPARQRRNTEPLRVAEHRFGPIIGGAPRMRQIYEHIEKVATTDATVMIRGESGTGKELIAEAIHRKSKRAGRPLVKVNCGALVESLLLSELFGHERGAFTGATQRKKGRFEMADSGTIFLDEIGDISPKTQVALLRVLQEREFERVGGVSPIHVDVRIICATNRDLEKMVARGEFREDLYYRLNGVRIEVPSLRERREDLPALAVHLLDRIAAERGGSPKRLTAAAEQLLQRYAWHGNVRELENVLRSVSLFSDSEVLDVSDFADYPELQAVVAGTEELQATSEEPGARPSDADGPANPYAEVRARGWSLRDYKKHVEVECIREAMTEANGNITRAAELLGMKRPRLSQLIKEHGIALCGAL